MMINQLGRITIDRAVKLASSIAVGCCLLVVLDVTAVAQPRDAATYLRPEHRAIVDEWLKSRPDLRLATDADNTNKDGLAAMRKERGRNYHPYYAVGDFNGDKKEDFAVFLVRKKKSKWPFVFAIFNGPLTKGSKPAYLTDDDIADGGVTYSAQNPARRGRLLFGTFETDNCVIVLPRGRSYTTRPCLGE